jgi:dynein heavy chain
VLNNWLCKKELVDTFRLILLNPIECRIPIDIVNKSIKRFIEESSSIKSNLSRIFNHMESSTLEQSNKPVWKPLLFSLCFFHAAITSRFSYAPNQMSSPLLITDSELESSISMVKNIVDEQEQIDWNSISYFVGECGYASKCVSEFDKKIMCCYFNKIIEPSAIQPNHRYSESDLYYLPLIENIQSIFTYIDKLPAVDSGIIFGLSDHANFLHSQLQSSSMFATLYKIDPSVDTIEKDNNKIVLDCINDIMGHLPPELDEKLAHKTIFAKLSNNILQPVTVVLQQEIKKYNILLHTMSQLFDSILKYISGQCQPSLIIEESFSQILINQIPSAIQKVNYCTHKSLSSWIKDLNTRISFFYKWLTKGRPAEYWLPAFYYPKGFLLSVIREHSLKNKIEFDHLGMSYEVLNPLENNDSDDGVSIFGLFLEGAKFSTEKDSLEDQSPPSWYFEMPSILCLPVENLSIAPEYYNCPLYYTQSKDMKKGNLLGSIDLPTSSRNSEYWSLKGVALHCQINN